MLLTSTSENDTGADDWSGGAHRTAILMRLAVAVACGFQSRHVLLLRHMSLMGQQRRVHPFGIAAGQHPTTDGRGRNAAADHVSVRRVRSPFDRAGLAPASSGRQRARCGNSQYEGYT